MTQPTPPMQPQPLPPPPPGPEAGVHQPPPEEFYRPISFWQKQWVQEVLPFVTSLAIHAAIIVVVVAVVIGGNQVIQKIKPLEAQLTSADSAIVEEGPVGGVQHVGL